MDRQIFLEEIARRRDDKGLSNRALCRKAGLNESTIKNIFSEKSGYPRIDTLSKIAKALNCTVGELLREAAPEWSSSTNPAANEELITRAAEEVLTYVREENLKLDPAEAAAGILDLYRQYEERDRPPTLIIAGNVVEFPVSKIAKKAG